MYEHNNADYINNGVNTFHNLHNAGGVDVDKNIFCMLL